MDWVLIISGILLLAAGLAGCILPVLPGPPLSYLALLLLHFSSSHNFSEKFLITWGIVAAAVTLVDYWIPVWGAKTFGASRLGVWGSVIGLLAGLLFFPPLCIIFGPFLGAVVGELLSGKDSRLAMKAGFGSFVGFLSGIMLKLIASGMMTWYFFKELIV